MRISQCIIDGEEHQNKSTGAPTVGIMVRGGTSASVGIIDCAVSTVDIGILTIDSGVNIARCLFNDITQDAVMATTERLGKESQVVPTMGIAQESESTGLNWYRSVDGFCVNNQTDALITAEVNDWYKYTSEEVSMQVNGPVDTEPFLGKSIGPGSIVATLRDGSGNDIAPSKNPKCEIPALNLTAQFDEESRKFIMNSVPPGTHLIKASALGYPSVSVSVEVTPLHVTPVSVVLTSSTGCGKDGRIVYAMALFILALPRHRRRRCI